MERDFLEFFEEVEFGVEEDAVFCDAVEGGRGAFGAHANTSPHGIRELGDIVREEFAVEVEEAAVLLHVEQNLDFGVEAEWAVGVEWLVAVCEEAVGVEADGRGVELAEELGERLVVEVSAGVEEADVGRPGRTGLSLADLHLDVGWLVALEVLPDDVFAVVDGEGDAIHAAGEDAVERDGSVEGVLPRDRLPVDFDALCRPAVGRGEGFPDGVVGEGGAEGDGTGEGLSGVEGALDGGVDAGDGSIDVVEAGLGRGGKEEEEEEEEGGCGVQGEEENKGKDRCDYKERIIRRIASVTRRERRVEQTPTRRESGRSVMVTG